MLYHPHNVMTLFLPANFLVIALCAVLKCPIVAQLAPLVGFAVLIVLRFRGLEGGWILSRLTGSGPEGQDKF